jgi:site-specific DNA recombinase
MQVRDESPEHHEKRARYYVEHKEWDVTEVYKLDAVSGKSVMGHPETKRMIADIKSGHITGLVFSKLARLARNTKELLEFSEIFRACNADLISLSENIDTSSPAGRLFYTMIAAMAEWEREEIASRVAASVPIRAKLGKPLGGAASYGFRWVNKELVVDEQEAPVRKLMYEIFVKDQRRLSTANKLNALGYRTRNGSKFTATTVTRLLRDRAAKGERIANYTKSLGDGKAWIIKPESEWVIMPCPVIVPPKLWDEANSILDNQDANRKPPGPKPVYLLSGYVYCSCGKSMYISHHSQTYLCKACKHRISVSDIDEIYQLYLKEYLNSIDQVTYIEHSDNELQAKKALLESTKKERATLAKQIDEWIDLRVQKELTKESFAAKYQPAEERLRQLEMQLPELEAEIDVRTIALMSSDTVIKEVKALYDQWNEMAFADKRVIVETITTNVEVGKEDIVITLAYAPTISTNPQNSVHRGRGSCLPPT